jgi:hypothetical protein
MKDVDIRSICKEKIESLEYWLRRLIDNSLSPIYGDYFSYIDENGNHLIKKELANKVEKRKNNEPSRYPRNVDAILLEDAVSIICKPELFKKYFSIALKQAFPDGREEAKTFLNRLLEPRNNLAHANAISIRQAEQITCYSNDVIESLKNYYRELGMQQTYDVPLILKVTDSFGNVFARNQCSNSASSGISLNFMDKPNMFLQPSDTLTLEVEVDPAFAVDSYTITWTSTKPWLSTEFTGTRAVIPITDKQVGESFDVHCNIISNKTWHRLNGVDDRLILYYKVLPPFA